MTQFAYTILYVKDVSKAAAFYETVFGFQRKFIDDKNQYAELITGSTTLSFASIELAKSNLPGGFQQSDAGNKPFGIEIGFATDDVVKLYDAAIDAGATAVATAKTKPWGQVVAYIKDLDGFLVEICTPMN